MNTRATPEPVAPTPSWLTNCCHCGRVIDKREQSDGGDKFGAELADGRWTCSFECYAAVVPDDAPTPSQEPDRSRMYKVGDQWWPYPHGMTEEEWNRKIGTPSYEHAKDLPED